MPSEENLEKELAEKIEELQEKVEKQEQKIEELEDREQETSKLPENVSRRSFMKMLGLGAGGLALSSQASAAWLSLNNDVSGGGGSTQTLSDVLSEGNDVDGQDIVDGGTTVWDTSAGHVPVSQVEQVDGLYADQSGNVAAGNAATATVTELADTETLEINWASFVTTDGQAAPSGVDVIIATFANDGTGTSQVTALSGDGSTVYDDESGSPLASYQNTTGSAQTVSIMVDNGQFNSGSGSDQSIQLSANARVV